MAHYSKKRPAFHSRTEIYRKSKWIKIKESMALFFSNVRRMFMKLAFRINEKGSQKLTIMIVPHSEKKIFNLQISNYIMFFFVLVLGVTLSISVFSISNNQAHSRELARKRVESVQQEKMIEEYKKSIDSLKDRYANFKADLSSIFKEDKKGQSAYNFKDIEISDDLSNNSPAEVKELHRLESELEYTKDNIQHLWNFIDQKKKLLKAIPSRYPLAVRWARITSPYGWRIDPVYRWKREFHPGVDLAILPGTPILATADGVVEFTRSGGGYGNNVMLRHKYGFETRYAHMMRFGPGIHEGAQVHQGQVIGYVGTTGKSTGYHLHYEVHIAGKTVDPLPYVKMLP